MNVNLSGLRMLDPPNDEGTEILDYWRDRVFYVKGKIFEGSGVLLNNKRFLTVSHIGFVVEDSYTIISYKKISFTGKCSFVSTEFDITILESPDFPDIYLPCSYTYPGSKFFLLGFPDSAKHDTVSITSGTIEAFHSDDVHVILSPSASKEFAGGPVIDDKKNLLGIFVGSSCDKSNNRFADRKVEQDSMLLLPIDAIRIILFNFEKTRVQENSAT